MRHAPRRSTKGGGQNIFCPYKTKPQITQIKGFRRLEKQRNPPPDTPGQDGGVKVKVEEQKTNC